MKHANSSTIPIATSGGVLIGGLIWLIGFALNVGSIEIDGPAGLFLSLSLLAGGVIVGLCAVSYEMRRHKHGVLESLVSLIVTILVSSLFIGAVIGSYANHKWSYTAIHEADCPGTEGLADLHAC